MPRLSDALNPALPLADLMLFPVLVGGGADSFYGVPLLAMGQQSQPRGNVLALRRPMTADLSATTAADPGTGKVRWNHATPGLATELYIDDVDNAAGDLSALWPTLTVGGFVYLQAKSTTDRRDTYQKWQITSVTDDIGYARIGVSAQGGAGAWVADETLELTLQQPTPAPGINRGVTTVATSVGGVLTLDAALGDYFRTTLHENVTSVVVTNVPQACTLTLRITQNATTARTVAFPASFLKRGGGDFAIPTTLGARHRMIFTTDDSGATWDADLGEAYA